ASTTSRQPSQHAGSTSPPRRRRLRGSTWGSAGSPRWCAPRCTTSTPRTSSTASWTRSPRSIEPMEPDRSTIWPYDAQGNPERFYYSRYDHPSGVAAEQALGRLEGGDALLYASGMGAVTNVLLSFARAGTRIALAEGAYFGTGKLFGLLEPWGLEFVEYDQTGAPPEA